MRRFGAFLLALCLCLSLLPSMPVHAASAAWDGTVDISWYDETKHEFYLSTPAQLAGLAALVNGMVDPTCPNIIGDSTLLKSIAVADFTLVGAGGGNVSDTVYTSGLDFSNQTVYLTADMDMGGHYDPATGTWSGPNWTPIGGKFPMLPQEVTGDCLTLDTRFNGVLDGQGHSIKNLYCDRYAEKGFPYSMAIGIVGYLGGIGGLSNSDEYKTFSDNWQPAVRNLILASGSIRGRRMVGGIVGRVGETSNGVSIENCANFASVHSTDAKGVGGIVGSGWGDGVIRGCYNAGSISTTYSSPAGGIVGTNGGMDIFCCYNIGPINTNGQSRGRAIGSHDTGTYTVQNCLYLADSGDDAANPGFYQGTSKRISVSVSELSSAELQGDAALATLNTDGTVFVPDTQGINMGYPVLWFQNSTQVGPCTVSIQPCAGGTVTADCADQAAFGQTVLLTAHPAEGCTLSYFTVNGSPISSNRFTVTGETQISAVFKTLRQVSLTIPEDRDFYVAVSCDGRQLQNNDTVTQEDVLTILLYGYPDAVPEELNLEYQDAYELSLSGAEKNPDGTYTVTGETDVEITVNRQTQSKEWIRLSDTAWYDQYPRLDTYTLTTPEQLAGLAELVNVRGIRFEGVTIRLGNDISLQNTDGTIGQRFWIPIGSNASKCFSGRFDGQGYAIYNLEISTNSSYAALFGCCKQAEIEDLSVYGTVSSTASAAYAAGIAAWFNGGSIHNCTSFVTLTVQGTHAGGIAAAIQDGASITDCVNCGSITAASGLGGIVGISDGGADQITACANFGTVTSTGNATYGTGGIAGRLAGSLTGCGNYGNVSGTDRFTGGLAGYATTKNHSCVTDSLNCAQVQSSNAMATAALGGLVGYAQFLELSNCEARGTVLTGEGFVSEHVGAEIGREGQTPVKAGISDNPMPTFSAPTARNFQSKSSDTYTVRFVAEGEIIAELPYETGTQTVAEPAVPQRAGYTGFWAPYALGAQDVTVQAIYRQILVRGGDTIQQDGRYFIAWYSSGEIQVAEGVQAELVGTNGGEDGFEGLSILVGRGASLTLEDTMLSGEGTLLTFAGDNTLTLLGTSTLVSRAETEQHPTLSAGTLTIAGEGSLFLTAGLHNPAIYIAPGSTVTLAGGRVCLEKSTLLGTEGGNLYANGAELIISGGELRSHTSSDNVAAVSADRVTLTAGTLLTQAEGSPTAIQAHVSASGGTLAVSGHTGNYTTDDIAYADAAACTSYEGTVQFSDLLPFADVSVTASWYDAVCWCWEKGIFSGVSEDSFAPDASMTRGMFVTVLYRMAGEPEVMESSSFADLTQDWYRHAVAWAVEQGITQGTSPESFSPDLPVSREQAAVFLYRYALAMGEVERLPSAGIAAACGSVSDWAEAECLWAIDRGLFAGTDHALAEPGADAPRHMLAAALWAYDQLVQSFGTSEY